MVLAIETITPELTEVQYEPSASDKIQKILYRLDQGEVLNQNHLKNYETGNFCVLGLFADESGLGHWGEDASYIVDNERSHKILSMDLVNYYGLNSEAGIFAVIDLPHELQSELFGSITKDPGVYCSLSRINDSDFVDKDAKNRLLASIIRSGAIFRKES